jgi:hypothetical protein
VEAGWGTQFYMSPEAQRGDAVVTEKADVFRYSPRLRLFLLSCVQTLRPVFHPQNNTTQLWRVPVAAPIA